MIRASLSLALAVAAASAQRPVPAPTSDPIPWIEVLGDPATREEAEFRLLQLGPAVGVHLRDAILARVRAGQPSAPWTRAMIVLGRNAMDAAPALAEVFAKGSMHDQAVASRAFLAVAPFLEPPVYRAVCTPLVDSFTSWDERARSLPAPERFRDAEYVYSLHSAHDAANDRATRPVLDKLRERLQRNIHDARIGAACAVLDTGGLADDERRSLLRDALERALAAPHDLVPEARCHDGFEWRTAQAVLARWPAPDGALDETAETCWRTIALTHPNSWCRAQAVAQLGRGKSPASLATLARALRDPARRVVLAAIDALAHRDEWYRAGGAIQDLILFADDAQVREAARALHLKRSTGR